MSMGNGRANHATPVDRGVLALAAFAAVIAVLGVVVLTGAVLVALIAGASVFGGFAIVGALLLPRHW